MRANIDMADLLKVEHLRCGLKQKTGWFYPIDDISFSLEAGKTLVLLGGSGSGKSMTALSLLQLLPHHAYFGEKSSIHFEDHALLQFSPVQMQAIRGKRIGFIFQEPMTALNPVLSIGDQLTEALALANVPRHERENAALQWLKKVGVSEAKTRYHAYPHQLSGGMKQRVMIAMALAAKPSLLIADEPTTALDVTVQAQIIVLLKQLQQELGMAILWITHDLAVASLVADDIAVMHDGLLLEKASVKQFFSAPQHVHSQRLLASNIALQEKKQYPKTTQTPIEVLSVKHLHVRFSAGREGLFAKKQWVYAVNDVDLTLYQGQTLALVGESGCGKTSLAKALMGLATDVSGQLSYDGQAQTWTSQQTLSYRAFIQMVFQDPYGCFNPKHTVSDILLEGLTIHAHDHDDPLKVIKEMLVNIGLSADSLTRYPHEFSGGQRQRLAIARKTKDFNL